MTLVQIEIIEELAKVHNVPLKAIHIADKAAAQNAPSPVTSYALFKDGEYMTNEILSEKKFLKMIEE